MKLSEILVASCLFACSGLAHANLIVNGGFEDPNISRGWTYGQDADGGWQGDNIEVWASGFQDVPSYEGTQHGELNAHGQRQGAWSIFQTFDTVFDVLYDVSFAYRARRSENEKFLFELFSGDTELLSEELDEHTRGEWSIYSDTFLGTGETTTLAFTAITPRTGTVGNFLDAVYVAPVSQQELPNPPVLFLFSAGLLALGFRRTAKTADH